MPIIPGKLHSLCPKTMAANVELSLRVQTLTIDWEQFKTLSKRERNKIEQERPDKTIKIDRNKKLELVIYEVVPLNGSIFYFVRFYKEKEKCYFYSEKAFDKNWFEPYPDAKIISLIDYKKRLAGNFLHGE